MSNVTHINTTMDLQTFSDRFIKGALALIHPDDRAGHDQALVEAAKSYHEEPSTCDMSPEDCAELEIDAWREGY